VSFSTPLRALARPTERRISATVVRTIGSEDDPHWELRQALLVLLAADAQTLWLLETLGSLARLAGFGRGWLA
jgi:hypothetical protein